MGLVLAAETSLFFPPQNRRGGPLRLPRERVLTGLGWVIEWDGVCIVRMGGHGGPPLQRSFNAARPPGGEKSGLAQPTRADILAAGPLYCLARAVGVACPTNHLHPL